MAGTAHVRLVAKTNKLSALGSFIRVYNGDLVGNDANTMTYKCVSR